MRMRLLALLVVFIGPLQAQPPEEWILSVAERSVLESFFRATGGAEWTTNAGWLRTDAPCEWEGIHCEPTTFEGGQLRATVMGLSLPFNGLKGQLPPDFQQLTNLKFLDLRGNSIGGTFPEAWLDRWDRNEFELSIGGNRFSNLASKIRIEVSASGVRCSFDEDTHYFYEFTADGSARFESIMCGKRDTEYVRVREGEGPTLDRASRALKRLGFFEADANYSYPFTGATHQTYIRSTVWYGDKMRTVETYGGQGPISVWTAENVIFGLVESVRWKKEYRKAVVREQVRSNSP
jgi:hypothetical protein